MKAAMQLALQQANIARILFFAAATATQIANPRTLDKLKSAASAG